MFTKIKDIVQGKCSLKQKRSNKWPAVRKQHLKLHPACRVCGGKNKVEVHHKKSFHDNPELELSPKNLVTLCESKKYGVNCHLFFGHLGNYRRINLNVDDDVSAWQSKIKNRKII